MGFGWFFCAGIHFYRLKPEEVLNWVGFVMGRWGWRVVIVVEPTLVLQKNTQPDR